jgi:hypothetical protein
MMNLPIIALLIVVTSVVLLTFYSVKKLSES